VGALPVTYAYATTPEPEPARADRAATRKAIALPLLAAGDRKVTPVAEPSTDPVSPFNPAAAQVPREGPGCSKPLLIGCGVVLLLLLVGVVIFRIEFPGIVRWWFHQLDATLAPRLPADATAAERQRLHRAFEAAGRAAATGQVDIGSMQRFQRKLMALADPEVRLSRKDVQELSETLEAMSRGPGAAPPSQPPAPLAAPPPARPAAPAPPSGKPASPPPG
jgi:hypothetical protein